MASERRFGLVINEQDMAQNKAIRVFVKWWFDLVKNFFVVILLGAASDKSHSTIVTVMYWLSSWGLTFYCLSYAWGIYFYPFRSDRAWVNLLWVIPFALALTAIQVGINILVYDALKVLAAAQAAK